MAKQGSYGRLVGKADGRSFYYSQVGGYLSRAINPAMSERVKTDPAFANTRLNAAEFGAAGRLAGKIVSPVSQRWRYILNPVATGLVAKKIKEGMLRDTTNVWGQRKLPLSQMGFVQDLYNSLSKNEMLPEVVQSLENSYVDADGSTIVFNGDTETNLTLETVSRLTAQGAEGVIVSTYVLRCGVPVYDSASDSYTQGGRSTISLIGSEDVDLEVGLSIINDNYTLPTIGRGQFAMPQNSENWLGGVLVVVRPYKVINNENYILQELCSAMWLNIPDEE